MLCQVTRDNYYPKINPTDMEPQIQIDTPLNKSKRPQSLLEQTIFIVEDNPDLQFLYQMLLKKAGWTITGTALNGSLAVEMYQTMPRKPAIILLDILLPGCSGLTVNSTPSSSV